MQNSSISKATWCQFGSSNTCTPHQAWLDGPSRPMGLPPSVQQPSQQLELESSSPAPPPHRGSFMQTRMGQAKAVSHDILRNYGPLKQTLMVRTANFATLKMSHSWQSPVPEDVQETCVCPCPRAEVRPWCQQKAAFWAFHFASEGRETLQAIAGHIPVKGQSLTSKGWIRAPGQGSKSINKSSCNRIWHQTGGENLKSQQSWGFVILQGHDLQKYYDVFSNQ